MVLAFCAYKEAQSLPDIEEDDYIHVRDRKKAASSDDGFLMRTFASRPKNEEEGYELEGLLSEVENSIDGNDIAAQLPKSFASFTPP